ncbi:hypothetical protein ABBQ38_012295 [Trebouxia sp. C0009 RCD-2024]
MKFGCITALMFALIAVHAGAAMDSKLPVASDVGGTTQLDPHSRQLFQQSICQGPTLCVGLPQYGSLQQQAEQCPAGYCLCYEGQANGGCSAQAFTAGCDAQCRVG